jgi:hypothetical protein
MKKLIVFCLLLSSIANAQVVRGPYLQSPTSASIKIMWRTAGATNSKVMYGTDPQSLTMEVIDTAQVINHTVPVTGLQPNTQYYYSIGTTTQTLSGPDSLHRFKTAPSIGTIQPVKAWVMGDFGKGNSNQQQVRNSFEAYNPNFNADMWLWLGDNVYQDGTDLEYSTKVFDSIYGYHRLMKYLPFMPAPGNHDYNVISTPQASVHPNDQDGPYFDLIDVFTNGESGGVPSGTEKYYSFDYGNVHFLSLNSELGSIANASHDWIGASPLNSFNGSPFTQWLQADLEANTQPWVVAYWHQSPHTDGSHHSSAPWEIYMKAMRENICPMLEDYGVDLILTGHSHVYERSYFLHNYFGVPNQFDPAQHVIDSNTGDYTTGNSYVKYKEGPNAGVGTVYAVVGSGGSEESDPGLQHPAMFFNYGCENCVGSLFLTIHGDTLKADYLKGNGEVTDHFGIIKKQTAPTAISVTPSSVAGLIVYPNPTRKVFNIQLNLTKNTTCQLQLFDMQGKLVKDLCTDKELKKGEHKLTFSIDELGMHTGVYLVKYSDGAKVYSRALVVEE